MVTNQKLQKLASYMILCRSFTTYNNNNLLNNLLLLRSFLINTNEISMKIYNLYYFCNNNNIGHKHV